MNESHNHEPQAYQTGPTTPPKSHGGIIAFLLITAIFFSGIVSVLSFMNIPVFQLMESQEDPDVSRLSKSYPTEAAPAAMMCQLHPSDHGIRTQALSDVCRNYYSLPQGLYITQVETDTDFYAQGLRSGDILLDLNDTPVSDSETLESILVAVADGDPVKLTFYRRGNRHQVTVRITTLEEGE